MAGGLARVEGRCVCSAVQACVLVAALIVLGWRVGAFAVQCRHACLWRRSLCCRVLYTCACAACRLWLVGVVFAVKQFLWRAAVGSVRARGGGALEG